MSGSAYILPIQKTFVIDFEHRMSQADASAANRSSAMRALLHFWAQRHYR